jgi:hypothetical protein
VDSSGNAYVTGSTDSIDFPITQGAYQTSPGPGAVFVAKLDAGGNGLVYSTYIGGASGYSYGQGIGVDTSGNAYVTGYTYASDFPTTVGAFQTARNGTAADAFVLKLDNTGSALAYSTYLGGSLLDYGYRIAVDSNGNASVIGYTRSADFPLANAFQSTAGGGTYDAFVTKLNATGASLVFSTYLGV